MRSDSWTSLTPSGATLAPRRAGGNFRVQFRQATAHESRSAALPNARPEGVIPRAGRASVPPSVSRRTPSPTARARRRCAGRASGATGPRLVARGSPARGGAPARRSTLRWRRPTRWRRCGPSGFPARHRATIRPPSRQWPGGRGHFRWLHGMADRAPFTASAGRPADRIARAGDEAAQPPGALMRPAPALLSAALAVLASTSRGAPADDGARVEKVADGVFVILHDKATEDWPHGNTGVVVGERGHAR